MPVLKVCYYQYHSNSTRPLFQFVHINFPYFIPYAFCYSGSGSSPGGLPQPFNLYPFAFILLSNLYLILHLRSLASILILLHPIYLFQFADDAAVIKGLERENLILLNHFTRLCDLADMPVRLRNACHLE